MPVVNYQTGATSTLQGIAFPFSAAAFSFPATNSGLTTVVDAVKGLLLTGLGELPMEPSVGTNLHEFVFETVSELTKAQLSSEVRRLIQTWEPRMTILSVTTSEEGDIQYGSRLAVHIEYELNNEAGEIDVQLGT